MALMKTQFAATVSHEVRTPLNGVVGMLDMLKEMRLTKRQQECVDVAWNSSRTLIELINDILDFSKMEAGKLELEEIDFDLRNWSRKSSSCSPGRRSKRAWRSATCMAPDVPERVRGDSLRLRQVLINLIGNAVKFTEHGEVAISICTGSTPAATFAPALRRAAIPASAWARDAVQHVFESFAQADPFHHAQVWRHRAWPGDLQAAGRTDGGRDRRRQRARPEAASSGSRSLSVRPDTGRHHRRSRIARHTSAGGRREQYRAQASSRRA